MIPDWKDYLKDEETKYRKLGNIKCPAFNNEEIHFNYYGLRHIIYKDEKVRTKEEIIRRFGLMPYISNILRKVKNVDNEEKRVKKESVAYFWTIKYEIHSLLRVRIIIRRLNNGPLHFF